MSMLLAMMMEEEASAGGSPLDYGDDLYLFLDAEENVTFDGNDDVTEWVDDNPDTSFQAFTVPNGGTSPLYVANSQNSLPGILFEEKSNGSLARKLGASASATDNFFSGSGTKSISFAARLDAATDSRFNTSNTIMEKGYSFGLGWRLDIDPNGTLRFQHKRANDSSWSVSASGFYSSGLPRLVLGYVQYDGGNTSGSGSLTLYDNGSDEFITVGSVSTGSSSTIGSEEDDTLIIGNIRDPNNANANRPFQGPIFGLWMTKGSGNSFDQNYLRRWIV